MGTILALVTLHVWSRSAERERLTRLANPELSARADSHLDHTAVLQQVSGLCMGLPDECHSSSVLCQALLRWISGSSRAVAVKHAIMVGLSLWALSRSENVGTLCMGAAC